MLKTDGKCKEWMKKQKWWLSKNRFCIIFAFWESQTIIMLSDCKIFDSNTV